MYERKLLAPFWADIDTRNIGDVWFWQTSSQTLLDKANAQIRSAFPFQPRFTATNLIIVTWDHVGYFNYKNDKVIVFSRYIYLYGGQINNIIYSYVAMYICGVLLCSYIPNSKYIAS